MSSPANLEALKDPAIVDSLRIVQSRVRALDASKSDPYRGSSVATSAPDASVRAEARGASDRVFAAAPHLRTNFSKSAVTRLLEASLAASSLDATDAHRAVAASHPPSASSRAAAPPGGTKVVTTKPKQPPQPAPVVLKKDAKDSETVAAALRHVSAIDMKESVYQEERRVLLGT